MNVFSRYRIASVFALLAVSGAAFAQEAVNEEAVFDDAPPSLADNLPPDPSAATSELSEMAADGAAPQETMTQTHQSIIGEAMRPFNSRRIELIEALVLNPTEVSYNGQSYPLKNPQRLRLFNYQDRKSVV